MTILQEIQKWSEKQPAWQQDAISRLFLKAELSVQDYAEIFGFLKSENGIPDTSGKIPGKLAADQVAAPQKPGRLVQLLAIKHLCNVNALAQDQRLAINATGLTIVYGENGTGKSGYSRVFKKACRARDQSEPILPNANIEPGKSGPPQAKFELLVDGEAVEVTWNATQAPPEQLSSIAIFDSHCARAYVDNRGDFAFVPYGLDILAKLVKVCERLKDMAAAEQAANRPNLEIFAAVAKTSTKAGALLATLSAETKLTDVIALADMTEEEKSRFLVLTQTLAEPDPKQKAQALRTKAARLSALGVRIGARVSKIDDAHVASLKILIEKSIAAKLASDLAGKAFREDSAFLPNTGSDAWKTLFEAARIFAVESHPGKEFPHLGPESNCPLCQNPLQQAGAARLEAFDAFVQQEAEKAEKVARGLAVEAFRAIDQDQFDLALDPELLSEIESISQEMAAGCIAIQQALHARRASLKKAAAPGGDWNLVTLLPPDPRDQLAAVSSRLNEEAKALEDSMDARAKAEMIAAHAELDARRRLAEMLPAVLDAIRKAALTEKLRACASAAGATTGISKKSTELSNSMATEAVVGALNQELKSLNVHELKVLMKPESPKGKTQYKLVLETPANALAKDILSEGEQRAIAIASFLAEVNLGGGRGGVVFDDPVSSLDHRRRWHVARRLAKEAKRRQVIVLTHDIYFLCILQQEAANLGLEVDPQCIRKTPRGFGVQSPRLPFDAMSTSKRIKALRLIHSQCLAMHKAGDEEEYKRMTRDAYFHLRLAWERGVEEVLLQGAVTRFDEGISTQKLSYVTVEDSDYKSIDEGMTKSSKFAHDPAAAAHLPTPSPDELLRDIEALETWRKSVETRKDAIRVRRT